MNVDTDMILSLDYNMIVKCIASYYHVPEDYVVLRHPDSKAADITADVAKRSVMWVCKDTVHNKQFTMWGPSWITPGMRCSTIHCPSFVIVGPVPEGCEDK